LAVVQKIVQDHGGEVVVERTASGQTVFRITLPGRLQDASSSGSASSLDLSTLVPAQRDGTTQNSISHPSP
jgi:hypothetical protein